MYYTLCMRIYHTDEEILDAIKQNISIAGALGSLKRAKVGSNYRWMHREVARLEADTSHWKGQAHGTSVSPRTVDLNTILVRGYKRSLTSSDKKRILRAGLLERKCQLCNLGEKWEGKPLVLRLDHINGDRYDHRIENLRLLCPNCDSQTDTVCGRNKRR